MTTPRLALLVCDTPIPAVVAVYGTYPAVFARWLVSSAGRDITLQLDAFDVVRGELPDPSLYDGMIITGSAASAYDNVPWIGELTKFVRAVAMEHPRVKLIGICFGHQIIAQALAGSGAVERNERGWEAGVYDVELSDIGRRIFHEDTLAIHQMHRDHVVLVPDGMVTLGSTEKCPVHGLVKFHAAQPHGAVNLERDVHVLSVQGHPEFTPFIVNEIVKTRGASGVMSPETVSESLERANRKHDGDGLIGKTIWRVLGLKDV